MIPKDTPAHKAIAIPKSKMDVLPPSFELSPLGDKKDAMAQYRGPNTIHILEYPDKWMVHWDYGDPRNPLGAMIHIFADAPEVGFSVLVAFAAGKRTYDETESVSDALLDGFLAGLFTYGGVKVAQSFIDWIKSL